MPATARTSTSSPASPKQGLVRNLRQPTPVQLRLQGRDLNGTATAGSDPEAVAAGLCRYLARYPKAATPLEVWLDTNGTPHRTATGADPLVVVTVHLDRS
jgi:hypothetical protein